QDFYFDLLFYHIQLRCFVVIEFRKGVFSAEYAGKMNFYLAEVDSQVKNERDNATIGLILCEGKRNIIVAEYAPTYVHKPPGVASYQLTKSLPDALKGKLPDNKELEETLKEVAEEEAKNK